jgi:hypothetical protein
VVSENDETAVRQTLAELQSALAEYMQRLRLRAAGVADKIYALQLESWSNPEATEKKESDNGNGDRPAAAD